MSYYCDNCKSEVTSQHRCHNAKPSASVPAQEVTAIPMSASSMITVSQEQKKPVIQAIIERMSDLDHNLPEGCPNGLFATVSEMLIILEEELSAYASKCDEIARLEQERDKFQTLWNDAEKRLAGFNMVDEARSAAEQQLSTMREALEKYANHDNWAIIESTSDGDKYESWYADTAHGYTIAEKALASLTAQNGGTK